MDKTNHNFYQRGESDGCVLGLIGLCLLGLLVAWLFGFNFGSTNEGVVKYSDCSQIIKLQEGGWQTYFHKFTCSYGKTTSGVILGGDCAHMEFSGSTCTAAYVYELARNNTGCENNEKNGIKYPYLGYDDNCHTTPQY